MAQFGFGKQERLRTSFEFRRVFERRCSVGNSWFVLYALGNDLGHARLGLSVSRKFGDAVRRNRFKRLVREAFRLSKNELPKDLDLVIVPRSGATPTLADLRQTMVSLAQHLHQRLRRDKKRAEEPRGT